MYISQYLASAFAVCSIAHALSIPEEAHSDAHSEPRSLALRNVASLSFFLEHYAPALSSSLEKRKGGGGGKGGGSGGSKSGSSSSSSSSSGSRTSSSSNVGGQTKSGSGVKPAYGGSKYYSGGASVPYSSGGKSPSGISPAFLPVAGLGFLGGAYLYGAYVYPYPHYYYFYNRTATNETNPNGVNTTLPVSCTCGNYATCGCDANDDQAFLDSIIGNGSYSALNQSIVQVVDYNGTKTIFLNGTLDNGTTAAGGVDDAAGSLRAPYQAGLWTLAGAVGYAVMIL